MTYQRKILSFQAPICRFTHFSIVLLLLDFTHSSPSSSSQVLEELRKLQAYQEKELGKQAQILALGLSSRKNLCIHPRISGEGSRENVDAGCRKLTATWVRAAAADNPDIELCDFFEGYEKKGADALLPAGVYTLHDMKVGVQDASHLRRDSRTSTFRLCLRFS